MGHELRMQIRTEPGSGRQPGEEEEEEGFREEPEIPRRDTGIRIALTLLFLVVMSVLETVLAVVVVFELVVALGTEAPPSDRVREFANRLVGYYYRIGRYLTYNESRIPFPFDDFPDPVEEDAWRPGDSESRALGLGSGRSS